jgi:hypothetical protein
VPPGRQLLGQAEVVPAWGVAAIVWAVSVPIALRWTYRRGFLATADPIIVFRVPIVCFAAPAVAIAALVDLAVDRLAGPPG